MQADGKAWLFAPSGSRRRPAAGALRAGRVADGEPVVRPAVQPDPADLLEPGQPLQPQRRDAGRGRVPLRVHDVPADRAPHRGRDEPDPAVPRRTAAGVLLRGLTGARGRAAARPSAAGRPSSRRGRRSRRGCWSPSGCTAADPRAGSCTRSACRTTGVRTACPSATPPTNCSPWSSTRTSTSRSPRRRPATSDRAAARAARLCFGSSRVIGPERVSPIRRVRGSDHGRGASMTNRLAGPLPDPAGDAGHPSDHPPRVGFFTDTSVCIGCKACEVACKEWNMLPEDGLDLLGMSYDNTGGTRREHLAARGVHRAARAGQREPGCRPRHADGRAAGAVARPGSEPRRRRGRSRRRRAAFSRRCAGRRRGTGCAAVADVERRLQALHPRRLPRRLPDGCVVPYRVRHRGRPGRHLQRLRVLRAGLPVRRDRHPARQRRRVQVHDVLRPARCRTRTGLCEGLPDRLHPVRPAGRAAGAGAAAGHRPAGRRRRRPPGCTATTRTTAWAATARSSSCWTSRRSTDCRPTRW